MEIITVFGVKWIKASYPQIAVIAAFLLFIGAFLGLLKYYQYLKNKKIHDESLFLFKMKRLGLSNFQIKLINNMVRTLKLSNPNELLEQSALFEAATGKFLQFLKSKTENLDALASICKDITITYEKVYNPGRYKKPLESISQIENTQLLYFTTEDGTVYLGKILTKVPDSLTLKLFRSIKELHSLRGEQPITVYIWRIGDAEYVFNSKTISLDKNILTIVLPESFIRDQEFRHPYIETILPMSIVKIEPDPVEEVENVTGTLFKINDYEAVIRTGTRLDYDTDYALSFEIMEFQFKIVTRIIANKTVEEGNIIYYTLKFTEMSDAARSVLKKYIYEHL
ncbi:MAG TPA: hypothetical protein PK926_02540 [Spirochaetota bacterium]|nr:hypothetical protein [Spirochaetota bacterium]HPI88389.1 hypothetical protein [Spirochaetota bacterium]HPR46753.1 hypothetical protein [Spirochaetota bacterium]